MTVEEFKYGLQRLGWSTEPAELIQFYCSAQRAVNLHHINQPKIPKIRVCHCYIKSLETYPPNAFSKDLPIIEADWQADLYDELVEEMILHSLSEYSEMMIPGRVKNQKFFSALESQYNKPLFQSYCFYMLIQISPEVALPEAYDRYLQLAAGSDAPLTEDAFQKLYCLMNWRELRDDTTMKASAKEANSLLNDLFVSNRIKCEIVAEILPRLGRLKSGDVQAPAAYLAKILYGDSKAYQNVNASGKIDQIIKQLSKSVSFNDFLTVLMSDGIKSENLAECGFLLPWFQEKAGKNRVEALCFVNASPAFLTPWKLDFGDSITVPYDTAKKPVSEKTNASVYAMDELEQIHYAEKQIVLYFSRGYKQEETSAHLRSLCRDGAVVYVVLPDSWKNLTVEIPGCSVKEVTILPPELFKGSTKKHFVAMLVPERLSTIDAQSLQVKMIDRRCYLSPSSIWKKTSIVAEDYETNQTLRSLFRQASDARDTVRTRERPHSYTFLRELTLWYTSRLKNNGLHEVCLYLCEVPTEQQKKRNKYERGRKIKLTETWNTGIKEDEIADWIETKGAWNEKLRSPAVDQIELYLNRRTMSLKSIWYCLGDCISFRDDEIECLMSLLRSEPGAKLVIGEASEEDIEAAILQAGEDPDVLAPILDTLFDLAVKKKYIKVHPFEALHEARQRQRRREESIRALAKRNYTLAEEEKIWEYYAANRTNPGALGMIICFFTGLTPPVVAALTWNDWRRITHTKHTQLVVNKKRLVNGEIEWQTDEDNSRLIPIADLLSEVLEEQKESLSPRNDDLIISTEKSPLTSIREQIRTAELYAGIAPDLISVPDSEKQIDLNQYGGSRMRENFEHHCYVDCGMTDAEVHHLILRKMPDTLSKNYVDYGHECIQERMVMKLNQWTQRFQKEERGWKTLKIAKQGVILKAQGNQTEVYNLTVQTDSPLRIIAECDHDYELRFLVRSEEAEK